MSRARRVHVTLGAVGVAAIIGWVVARPFFVTTARSSGDDDLVETAADMVDDGHVQAALTRDPSAYLRAVKQIGDRLRANGEPELALGVEETMNALVEPDVESMFAVWRSQGRTPAPRKWIGEEGSMQEKHDRRRAFFLTMELDPMAATRNAGPEVMLRPEGRDFSGGVLMENDKHLDLYADGSSPQPSDIVEILIPAKMTGLLGERVFRGAMGVGMVYHPGLKRWVMRSIGLYGGTPYDYLLPLI